MALTNLAAAVNQIYPANVPNLAYANHVKTISSVAKGNTPVLLRVNVDQIVSIESVL